MAWDEVEEVRITAAGGPIRLNKPLDFIDVAISELTVADIGRLRHQLLRVSITMEFRDGTLTTVTSVQEYDDALAGGAFAPTAMDLRLEGIFKNASAIFRAVAIAQAPDRSHISRPHVGVSDLDLLPSTLIQWVGTCDGWNSDWSPRLTRLPTIGDFVRSEEATVIAVGSSSLTVRASRGPDSSPLQTTISELLRADLNDDGLEDILVAIHGRAVGGSYVHSAEPVVLSRRSPTGIFSTLELRV